ncbi:MAG: hypothetical protein MRY57_03850 [Candidatus Pacebacteria bacterium]|nr:hypothetical protein [Candidatus Paceibacterota bacterium]
MKNVILTFVLAIMAIGLNAQNTTNQYAVLTPGHNFANNDVARNYAATGNLPNGYSIQTAQQIANARGYEGMWVEYNQAAPVNTEVNGGHYQNPAERFIIMPNGNIHSAVTCGNTIKNMKFYGKIEIVVRPQVNVTTQVVDLTETNQKLDNLTAGQAQLGQNQQVILAEVRNNGNAIATIATQNEQILANTEAAARYAKQSRNWAIAGTIVSGIGATASTIDLLNGDGNVTVQNVTRLIERTTTNNNYYNQGNGGNTDTGGPGHNGNGGGTNTNTNTNGGPGHN